jgi:hypothetical protein
LTGAAGGGGAGANPMQGMMQQMMSNPALMQQMMSSPMVQQMTSNPALMQQMLNNPAVQAAMPGKLLFLVFVFFDVVVVPCLSLLSVRR